MKCAKHNRSMECLAGCSAHPSNWYCPECENEPHQELIKMSEILKYFEYEHLPEELQSVSKACSILAKQVDHYLPQGPEKSAGLRKLLEAKDCFVRASLPAKEDS